MFELIGKIEFDPVNVTKKHNKQASWKKTAMVKFDCDIWEYYSWFLKKRFNLYLNKPLRGTHLTIINDKFDPETEYLYDQGRQLFHGKEIRIRDFGAFKQRNSAPRKGRNPKTGEEIFISGSKSVTFTSASCMKTKTNGEGEAADE